MGNLKFIALGLIFAFLMNVLGISSLAQAQDFVLPAPGTMVSLSPAFVPPVLKGIKVHPDNPFRFEFILDHGDSQLGNEQLKDESTRLIKYFLASLTIPEKDLWVNLNPYEKNHIVPESFGQTEMGRDLLAEDYMLKQITASLIYPEGKIGERFWKRIYQEASKKFGTTNIPVNTFNKVWIVPEKAVVYENTKAGTAYVVESKLKVMLEQDHLSLQKHEGTKDLVQGQKTNQLGSQIVREIVIPELTKEVNKGKNFIQLRQIYNSLILATWYKKKIKDSILAQVYENKNKVVGVNIDDPKEKERIYQRYLKAFKKGVYNYIKEEPLFDPASDSKKQGIFPRKYFSGGAELIDVDSAMRATAVIPKVPSSDKDIISVDMVVADNAMTGDLAGIDDQKSNEERVAAILSLQREGKQIFNLKQAQKLSRKRRAAERVLFLNGIVNILEIEGRYLFSASQLMKITLSYKLGDEGSLLEQVSWLLDEKDAEGKPLFNGSHISQIIHSGAEAKDKKSLIEYLVGLKDAEGKPLFNGSQISYVVRSYTRFERSKFESMLKMSTKLKISLTIILYVSIITSDGKNTIKKWLIKNISDLSGQEKRLIYSLLSNTEFNVSDLVSLIKILFTQEEQAEVLRNLENKNEVLKEIAKRVLGRDLENSDNEDIKNLLMSPTLEIRQRTMGKIIDYVYSNLNINVQSKREITTDDEEKADAVSMYITSYDWLRPNTGLDNLVRNSRIIIQYRKAYLYWKRLPDPIRVILWKVKQLNKQGVLNGDVERHLIDAGYSHYEIAQAMGFRQQFLDAPFNEEGNGTLYDVIASENIGIDLRDIAVEEEIVQAHTVNVNVMGRIVSIQADTVGQALRIYWERYGSSQEAALIKSAVNEGRSDVSIDGEMVDPTEVLDRSLEGVHDISIQVLSNESEEETDKDKASLSVKDAAKGGIDFNTDRMNLQIHNKGGEIKFNIDPAILVKLQNAPGFVPVVINFQRLNNLQQFLTSDDHNPTPL